MNVSGYCIYHADKFKEYLSSKHSNINFSTERKRKMVVYLFQMLKFFVKTRNLQPTSTEKRFSVGFIPTST